MRWIVKTWKGFQLRQTSQDGTQQWITYLCLTVADILTKYFLTFSWDDFKFKVALKLHNLANFLTT